MITTQMYLQVLAIAFVSILLNIGYTLYFLIRNNPRFKAWIEDWLFEDDEEGEEDDNDNN